MENWKGEAPLVTEPYAYGVKNDKIDLAVASGSQLWGNGR